MIYTITLNPAIDRVLKFKKFTLKQTNRAYYEDRYAAGKGIHVSKLLTNLEFNNIAIYASGENDQWFAHDLQNQKIRFKRFNSTKGNIRTNLKIIDNDGLTECTGLALTISSNLLRDIIIYLDNRLLPNDFVIISGSMPLGINIEQFLKFVKVISKKNIKLILDLSDIKVLIACLQFKPFLIKPNQQEMEYILQENYTIEKLLKYGAQNIFYSQGALGGKLFTQEQQWDLTIKKKYTVINNAGAGDSFIAGFVSKIMMNLPLVEAAKFGIICGTATTTSEKIATKKKIKEIKKGWKW